jgi:hypothetical protein
LNNSREAVWKLQAQDEEVNSMGGYSKLVSVVNLFFQFLDGISANNESFPYSIPEARRLVEDIETCTEATSGILSFNFSLPNTLVRKHWLYLYWHQNMHRGSTYG